MGDVVVCLRGEVEAVQGEKMSVQRTNLWNEGLISADRSAETTLMLTIPRSLRKSSTKDLSYPILQLLFRHEAYRMV